MVLATLSLVIVYFNTAVRTSNLTKKTWGRKTGLHRDLNPGLPQHETAVSVHDVPWVTLSCSDNRVRWGKLPRTLGYIAPVLERRVPFAGDPIVCQEI